MNQITAQQAQALAQAKSNEDVFEVTLEKIYRQIEASANSGKYNVKLPLQPIALQYKEEIRTRLIADGYKVKIVLDKGYREWDDYITISWSV